MFAKVKDAPGFVRGIVSDKEAQPILNINNSAATNTNTTTTA